jgi:hypothetical protein
MASGTISFFLVRQMSPAFMGLSKKSTFFFLDSPMIQPATPASHKPNPKTSPTQPTESTQKTYYVKQIESQANLKITHWTTNFTKDLEYPAILSRLSLCFAQFVFQPLRVALARALFPSAR